MLEMDKYELSVVCLSEMRWPGKGEIVPGNYIGFHSGRKGCCSSVDKLYF